MGVECGDAKNEISKQSERLLPEHKLLLAGPATVISACLKEDNGSFMGKIRTDEELMERLIIAVIREWYSIYNLFTKLVGKNRVVVTKTEFLFVKHTDHLMELKAKSLPKKLGFDETKISFSDSSFSSWPRDAYGILNDKILGNPKAFAKLNEKTKLSKLGEQGGVLVKNKAVLVEHNLWKNCKNDIKELTEGGFGVGCLPTVNASKQKYEFKESHIDGHSALIEDKNGELNLLVTDSYSRQGNDTKKKIKLAADTIGAKMIEIDDRNLSPLALNLVQFEDRSIALTSSEYRDLELTLKNLVGSDKVFETDIPIIEIPRRTFGSIRCITNILSPALIELFQVNVAQKA